MKRFLYYLLPLLCLGAVSCDKSDDGPGFDRNYEVNEYLTAQLVAGYKITEHEYSDKGYYTKDFETSWLIGHYNDDGTVALSYKPSLQSQVEFYPCCEVGNFSNGTFIVNPKTGDAYFEIESTFYDGFILKDYQTNRFRCEELALDMYRNEYVVYFVKNETNYDALKLQYISYTSDKGFSNISYTVNRLEKGIDCAYAVLLGKNASDVSLTIEAPDGKKKLLTAENLNPGWNRSTIIERDFVEGENGGENNEPNLGESNPYEPIWVGVQSPENLWNGISYTTSFYYAPNWNQIDNLEIVYDENDFTVSFPFATFDPWQAQVHFSTDLLIPTDGKTYDFCITYLSNKDITVKTWLMQHNKDDNFLFRGESKIYAGRPYKFWISGVAADARIPNVELVLAFGGNPDNTVVKVSNIILQVHND